MSIEPEVQERFRMAGTEGTYEYIVVALSDAGRVGYRVLSGLWVRVRLEINDQVNENDVALPGWKQPEPNNRRYSTVVDLGQPAVDAIELALATLTQLTGPDDELGFNPDATQWREALNPKFNDEPGEPEVTSDDPATEPTPAPKRRRLRLPTLLKRGRRRDTAAKQ